MADLATLERALRNADAAGDVEAARTIAAAIKTQQGPKDTQSGFAMGLADPIHGGAQLLTKMLPDSVVKAGNSLNNWIADKTGLVAKLPEGGVDQQVREREAAYQAQRGSDGIDWARLGGNVLNPANVAVAARLPSAVSLFGRMGVGAAGGALSASLSPVGSGDFADEKAKQIGMGAAFGGAVPALAAGIGRVIKPNTSSDPNIRALLEAGVKPTPGQMLGGAAARSEEKLMSLPVVGDAARNARAAADESLRASVANRALAPIGEKLPKGMDGRELVKHVDDTLGAAYNKLLPKMTTYADEQFSKEIGDLAQMVRTGAIDPKIAAKFDDIMGRQVLGKFQGDAKSMTGETMKQVESDLGQFIRRFARSEDPDVSLLRDALMEARATLRRAVERSNPNEAPQLAQINKGWAIYDRLSRAASYQGAEEGKFGAAQLSSAVKAADRSKRGFGKGDALLQELSDPAKAVMSGKVPNSGTIDRGAFLALPAMLADPLYASSLLAAPALYSKPGQALVRAALTSRPAQAQSIAGLLNNAAPMFAPAGGLLGVQAIN